MLTAAPRGALGAALWERQGTRPVSWDFLGVRSGNGSLRTDQGLPRLGGGRAWGGAGEEVGLLFGGNVLVGSRWWLHDPLNVLHPSAERRSEGVLRV